MNTPVPEELQDEFVGYMSGRDNAELDDILWWQRLSDTADDFMIQHNIKGDSTVAVHQYLIWRS